MPMDPPTAAPPSRAVRVTLLGTAAGGNTERCYTAIVVQYGGHRILIDTAIGREAAVQCRAAGIDEDDFAAVLLTHPHIDHMGGLHGVVAGRGYRAYLRGQQIPPLSVFASPPVVQAAIAAFRPYAINIDGAVWRAPVSGAPLAMFCEAGEESIAIGDAFRVRRFEVPHGPRGSSGWRIDAGGKTIVYSGDTPPCEAVVEASRGADLLIHEAGGLEQRAEVVHRQGHSTAADAGHAASAAGVQRLLLTHVPPSEVTSARDLLAEARRGFAGPVEVAVDLLSVEL